MPFTRVVVNKGEVDGVYICEASPVDDFRGEDVTPMTCQMIHQTGRLDYAIAPRV